MPFRARSERADRRPAPGRLPQMAVLRAELRRAAIIDRAFPREEPRRGTLGYGDFDTVMNVLAKPSPRPLPHGRAVHRRRRGDRLRRLRWGMMFKLLPERPEFVDYVGRLDKRPALQRATALDQELAAAWTRGSAQFGFNAAWCRRRCVAGLAAKSTVEEQQALGSLTSAEISGEPLRRRTAPAARPPPWSVVASNKLPRGRVSGGPSPAVVAAFTVWRHGSTASSTMVSSSPGRRSSWRTDATETQYMVRYGQSSIWNR